MTEIEKIYYYKDLLYGFNLSGLTRSESLDLLKLTQQLYEAKLSALKYHDKYQKSVETNKKLHRKYAKVNNKLKKQRSKLKELELDSEEMNKHMDEFFKRMEENEIRKIDIVKTKGEDIMNRLYEILKKDGHLCDEDILYFPEKWNITSEEYQALFESMTNYAEERDFYCDEDSPFSNESVYYKYKSSVIELFTMSGQGTVTSFSVISEENIKEKSINRIIDFAVFIDSKKNH